MAVKIVEEKDKKLTLEIDNGDKEKLDGVLKKWNFKDHQSFMRFAVSALLLNKGNTLWINDESGKKEIKPSDELIKPSTDQDE